jgi:hypothetical protein
MGKPIRPLLAIASNAVAVAGYDLRGLAFLPRVGMIGGVMVANFGLGVFIQLIGHVPGKVIEQMPACAFVNARLLLIQPSKHGAERWENS